MSPTGDGPNGRVSRPRGSGQRYPVRSASGGGVAAGAAVSGGIGGGEVVPLASPPVGRGRAGRRRCSAGGHRRRAGIGRARDGAHRAGGRHRRGRDDGHDDEGDRDERDQGKDRRRDEADGSLAGTVVRHRRCVSHREALRAGGARDGRRPRPSIAKSSSFSRPHRHPWPVWSDDDRPGPAAHT